MIGAQTRSLTYSCNNVGIEQEYQLAEPILSPYRYHSTELEKTKARIYSNMARHHLYNYKIIYLERKPKLVFMQVLYTGGVLRENPGNKD